ncbi:methyl-accepting chemotaxis protein [Alloiococcus sp. CFN-8]|uniref:methyl-accepting chemotaxis protein n=1 Tax=Alloiococcus sp. CFN-8 TaxID=3416081 RepID=UPI003CEB3BB2
MRTIRFTKKKKAAKGKVKGRKASLKSKLALYTAICVIVAALVQTAISIGIFQYIIDNVIKSQAEDNLNSAAVTINSYMVEYENLVKAIADDERVIQAALADDKVQISMSLKHYIQNYPSLRYGYFKGLDREIVTYPVIPLTEPVETTEPDEYLNIMKEIKEPYWSEAYEDTNSKQWVVTVMDRIEHNGEFLGYVGIDIGLKEMSNMVNSLKFGSSGEFIMIHNNGIIMTAKDDILIGIEYPNKDLRDSLINEKDGNVELKEGGKNIYGAFKELNKGDINLLAKIDEGEFKEQENLFLIISIASIVLVLAITTLINLFVINKLIKRINRLKEDMKKIQEGDLTVRSDADYEDEIGELAQGFNNMTNSLKELIVNTMDVANVIGKQSVFIQTSHNQTLQSSTEISKTIEEVASVTNNQSMEVDKVATENGKLSKSINDISQGLRDAVELCENVNEVNKEGIKTVDKLVLTTDNTSEKTTSVLDNVQNIADSTRKIDMVLEAISDIANQTNLLSLNASIEAARAGEAGKGFSVVADAIRKLAEQSKDSTEDIKKIIADITGKTNAAVTSMEETRVLALEQIEAVRATEKAFKNISQSLETLISTISNINDRNNSMVRKKDRIEGYMEALSAGMTEISASAEEITASAEEQVAMVQEVSGLTEQFIMIAEELKNNINKFKVN